jgi:hypothetical protein
MYFVARGEDHIFKAFDSLFRIYPLYPFSFPSGINVVLANVEILESLDEMEPNLYMGEYRDLKRGVDLSVYRGINCAVREVKNKAQV